MNAPAPSRAAEPAPPAPNAPLGGAVVDGAAATFSWRGVHGASRYRLQLSPDRRFARDVLDLDAGPSTQLALLDALPLGQPLFWRVRAETPQGPTRWSPYGRFVPGSGDAADAFRAQEEAAEAAAHRERLRREAEEAATTRSRATARPAASASPWSSPSSSSSSPSSPRRRWREEGDHART